MSERRAVVGYKGLYEVSDDGKVFRVNGNERSPVVNQHGYLEVQLHFNRRQKNHSIHRLVAAAFLENPENLPMVHHKDCNKQNNHVSNLEWCTAKQNNLHRNKAVIGTHLVTGEEIEFATSKEAGLHGFHQGSVSDCCRGVHKTHKGYTWRWKITDPL